MRRQEVTFSVTEANDAESTERARRLALFVSTIKESPEALMRLAKEKKTVDSIIDSARHPDVRAYGEQPDYRDGFPREVRILYATGLVLKHKDDIEADKVDAQTSAAMRQGYESYTRQLRESEHGRAEKPAMDWRVERLGILAAEMSDVIPDLDGNLPAVDSGMLSVHEGETPRKIA